MYIRLAVVSLPFLFLFFLEALFDCPNASHAQDKENQKVLTIPLKEIYTVGEKSQMKTAPLPGRLMSLTKSPFPPVRIHGSMSDAFLVQGDDIGAAVVATFKVFYGGGPSADQAVATKNDEESRQYWLAVHLRSGKTARTNVWLVEKKGNLIRLSYTEPKRIPSVGTPASHYYWASLGELEPGIYTVELYDMDCKQVTFMRRVAVP